MGEKTGNPGHSFVSCSRCLLAWVYSSYLGAAPCTPPGVHNTDKLCSFDTEGACKPAESKEVWGGWGRREKCLPTEIMFFMASRGKPICN